MKNHGEEFRHDTLRKSLIPSNQQVRCQKAGWSWCKSKYISGKLSGRKN